MPVSTLIPAPVKAVRYFVERAKRVAGEDGISHRPEKHDGGEGARPEQEEQPSDQDGHLKVPDGPGIGVTPVEAAIKEGRMPGEPYWD